MKFILSIIYLTSFLAMADPDDGAVPSSLRGSNHRNHPTLADWGNRYDCRKRCWELAIVKCTSECEDDESPDDCEDECKAGAEDDVAQCQWECSEWYEDLDDDYQKDCFDCVKLIEVVKVMTKK